MGMQYYYKISWIDKLEYQDDILEYNVDLWQWKNTNFAFKLIGMNIYKHIINKRENKCYKRYGKT